MCYAIYLNAHECIDIPTLENIATTNRDGFGLIVREYVKNQNTYRTVDVIKTMDCGEAKTLLDQYLKYDRIAHWRFGTSGQESIANVHPLEIKGFGYLVHRGIANIGGHEDQSDTAAMAEILAVTPEKYWPKILPILLGNSRALLVPYIGDITKIGNWIDIPEGYASETLSMYSDEQYWRGYSYRDGYGYGYSSAYCAGDWDTDNDIVKGVGYDYHGYSATDSENGEFAQATLQLPNQNNAKTAKKGKRKYKSARFYRGKKS